ncbi:MAG: hypothetical protein IJS36_08030 [Kiritimatiellae bacterium]|nr:hypothetical protein [Kiritimatiellia bacterium]
MKRNRKRSKRMSVMASRSMHIGGVLVMFFVMVLVNLLASSSCSQLMKSIGEKERQLAKLENDRARESARWDSMKTSENLDRALLKFGLSMKYPRADQIVRMDSHGQPKPGQLSVARAARRASGVSHTAQVKARKVR